MRESIDALDLLEQQHQEIFDLFDGIDDADDLDDRRELFCQLADKIAAHTAIEEKLFYPSVLTDDTTRLLLEATEEHLAAKRVLADLLDLEADDDHFEPKLVVLRDLLVHHARDEEEDKLFPLVREALDEGELAALGNELAAMYDEIIGTQPRLHIPAETVEAAQL